MHVPFTTKQDPSSSSSWPFASLNCSYWTMVPHFPGLITGLSSSNSHTAILMVVDWFSRMAHFISPTQLPSANETAKLVLQHMFQLQGLPSHIVSDQGSKFTSNFWKEICSLLGASVSLSSGFYPRSNRQLGRKNRYLETILCCLTAHNPTSWSA